MQAVEEARRNGYEVIIVDTAGRLAIDAEMMDELKQIKALIHPSEILFVADAMTGQDAVNVAGRFDELLGIDGVIMTKMDGDARGGAALSLKAVIGKPIKFVGVGEKIEALEVFHPERMASRILGMGDVLTLVEKAQAAVDEREAQALEQKIRKNEFTLDDFRNQLTQIRKMGPLQDILGMIPGMKKIKALKEMTPDEGELVRIGGDHRFHDPQGAPEPSAHRRQPAQADRPGQRDDGSGCQPPAEELCGDAKNDEADDPRGNKIPPQGQFPLLMQKKICYMSRSAKN